MFGELSGEERMKYNQPHAGASWGTQAKDWERGIDYDSLFKSRLKLSQYAFRFAFLVSFLCFIFFIILFFSFTLICFCSLFIFFLFSLFSSFCPPFLCFLF